MIDVLQNEIAEQNQHEENLSRLEDIELLEPNMGIVF